MTELSIIVPVYNAEAFLAGCIESVLAQTFADYELLLIDDGSTDGSGEICDRYATRDVRVRVLHLPNGGPASARNEGLDVAVGRYIQFIDADDELEPECCAVFRDMARESDADVVLGGAGIFDGEGSLIRPLVMPPAGIHRTADVLRALEPATSGVLLNYVWNKWYRASGIQKRGIRYERDIRLGEDFLFNCAYLQTCDSVAVTAQPLYRYYKRVGDSLTRRFRADEMTRRRRLDGALAGLFRRFALATECKVVLDRIFGAAALDSVSSVGLRDCRLSHAGKVRFVGEFLDSEYRELIGRYRHAPGVSMVRRLECALAERHATWSLTSLLVLVARAKRVMGR
jgi:glycosyltransferase involved in cell wall biosynthesis